MAFNEKYVTVTGGGLHDGSSEANAWTFDEAWSNYSAGDRLNIKAGTYALTQIMNPWTNGTVTAPVSLRGYKTTIGDLDDRPSSQWVDGTDVPLIQTTNSSYYIYYTAQFSIIENISFEATVARPAIYARSAALYKRCRFVSVSTIGVNPVVDLGSNYPKFVDCYFEGSGSGYQSAKSVMFSGCVFENFYEIQSNGFFGAFDCVFKNFTNAGVKYNANNGAFQIRGCTFYNIANDAISVTAATTPSSSYGIIQVENNIFHTISGDALKNYSSGHMQLFAKNNLFYNVTGSNFANDGFGMSRDEQNDSTNPFVDAAGGDFSLVSGSNGYNSAAPKPFEVFDVNSNRDIGAVQHQDPAYVAPPDASASTKVFPFRSWVEGDFQQEGADADEFVEKHELQALPVFEFSIGTAAGRDYNSLTAFFADFDNTLVNVPNSKVIVTCYNDTGADQAVIETTTNISVNPPSNCRELIITVDDDSWHKGDFGKGCVIRASGGYTNLLNISSTSSKKIVLERLVIDGDAQSLTNSVQNLISTSNAPGLELKDLLIQGSDGTTYGPSSYGATGINVSGNQLVYINNCVVRNIIASRAGNFRAYGMNIGNSSSVNNCTVYNITAPNSAYTTKSMGIASNTGTQVNNSVAMQAVDGIALSAGIITNTVTDDSSGTYQSTPAGEFVDAANGDFKLKGTASAAGIVAATNAKVTDITGKLRKAGVAQDAGAFNNVAGYDDSPVFPPDQPTDPIIHPLRSN